MQAINKTKNSVLSIEPFHQFELVFNCQVLPFMQRHFHFFLRCTGGNIEVFLVPSELVEHDLGKGKLKKILLNSIVDNHSESVPQEYWSVEEANENAIGLVDLFCEK